jgi:dUTP pyrophosphatase
MVRINYLNSSDNPDPQYKHTTDAGFDLRANETITIPGGDTRLIDVGLRLDIPEGYEGQIRLRSSLAKKSVHIPNAPGTIDAGYKGPIMVAIRNADAYNPFTIKKGERFAQIVINELPLVTLSSVSRDEFFSEDTSRGSGGFGSTGKF